MWLVCAGSKLKARSDSSLVCTCCEFARGPGDMNTVNAATSLEEYPAEPCLCTGGQQGFSNQGKPESQQQEWKMGAHSTVFRRPRLCPHHGSEPGQLPPVTGVSSGREGWHDNLDTSGKDSRPGQPLVTTLGAQDKLLSTDFHSEKDSGRTRLLHRQWLARPGLLCPSVRRH